MPASPYLYTTEADYVARVMRKPHPQSDIAQVKRAYFDGLIVQYRRSDYGEWANLRPWQWRPGLGPASNVGWAVNTQYRIKPGQTTTVSAAPVTVSERPALIRMGDMHKGQVGVIEANTTFAGAVVMRLESHDSFGTALAVVLTDRSTMPMKAGSVFGAAYAGLMVRPLNFQLEGLE